MWISKPQRVRRIKPTDFPRVIELGGGETAQVKKDAGEFLIEHYTEFTIHESR
jgi:predicted DNA-binding transcriptional regulator AlpA